MGKCVTEQNHHHGKENTFQGSVKSLIVQASWKRKSVPWTSPFGNAAQKNIFPLVIISELGRLMTPVHLSAGYKHTLFPFYLCTNLRTRKN